MTLSNPMSPRNWSMSSVALATTVVTTAVAATLLMTSVASASDGGDDACSMTISSNDQMQFDKSELSVPASCETVSLTLEHAGTMDKTVMGHNWVLAGTDDYEEIAKAGMQAGLDNQYLPPDDERILAATDVIGGGESTTIEFSTDALEGRDLTFFCSFPGHYSMMKGSFTVTGS
ncbi:azurin [Halomonas sp. V046]|uniref:azurin n=1 Tax=Halomonas sp. V046 TaxID=3459611 RepID=UPI004044C58D